MADRALFIGWGEVVRGREREALANFQDTVGLYGKAQADGRIESFDVCLLDPHGGDLAGFMMVHGTTDQLNAFKASEDFRSNMAAGTLIVDGLGVVDAAVGEGVAQELATYTAAVEKIAGKSPAMA
jgi:hypothetical protein